MLFFACSESSKPTTIRVITQRKPGQILGKGKLLVFHGKDSSGKASVYQEITLKPNTTYKVKFCMRRNRTAGNSRVSIGKASPYLYNPTGWWATYTYQYRTDKVEDKNRLIISVSGLEQPMDTFMDDISMVGPDGKDVVKNGEFEFDSDGNGVPDNWHFDIQGKEVAVALEEIDKYLAPNEARLKFYGYKRGFISPHMISPLFLGLEYDFRSVAEAHRPTKLYLELDIPPGVEVMGFTRSGWGMIRLDPLPSQIVTRGGQQYTRVAVSVPRDRIALFYPGNAGIWWLLKTVLKDGTFNCYYRVRWVGGGQEWQKLPLTVVGLLRIEPPKRLIVGVDPPYYIFTDWPGFVDDLRAVGVNLIDCRGLIGKTQGLGSQIDGLHQQGMDLAYMTQLFLGGRDQTKNYVADTDSWAVDINGKKISPKRGVYGFHVTPCPTYRGKAFKESISHGKSIIDQGIHWIVFDDESRLNCFCDRCREGFKTWLATAHAELKYLDPRSFEKEPKEYKKLHAAWREYQQWVYGQAVLEYERNLQEYAKKRYPIGPNDVKMINCAHSGKEAAAYAFDYLNDMTYIMYDRGLIYPDRVGDRVTRLLSPFAPSYPLLSPGLIYEGAEMNNLYPHVVMKYQIWESLLAGAKGYALWAFRGVDLLDLRYMADAMRPILPVEDILYEGKPANLAKILSELASSRTRARTICRGNEAVLLISDYSTYKNKPTTITVEFTVDEPSEVMDLESGEKLTSISPKLSAFKVKLDARRARLFYVGPKADALKIVPFKDTLDELALDSQ